jgi:hypothetical protein
MMILRTQIVTALYHTRTTLKRTTEKLQPYLHMSGNDAGNGEHLSVKKAKLFKDVSPSVSPRIGLGLSHRGEVNSLTARARIPYAKGLIQ